MRTDADAGEPELPPDEPGDLQPLVPHRSIGRNAVSLLLSQGVSWSLAVVLTAVQPRFIGPAGIGDLRLASALWTMAGVFTAFGAASLITVELARGERSDALLRTAMGLQTIMYVVSSIAVLGFSLAVGYRGRLLAIIVIAGCAPLFRVFAETARSAFYGLEKMGWPAIVDIVVKAGTVVAITATLVLGGRTIAVTVVSVAVAVLQAAIMLGGLRRQTGFSLRPSWQHIRPLMRRAMPFLAIEASFTVYQQVDSVVMAMLVDKEQVGWYGAADQLLGSLVVIPVIIMTAVFPALARMSAQDPDAAVDLVRRGMRLLFLVGTPMGLGTLLVSNHAAVIIFGNDFRPSGPVIGVLGVLMILLFPSMLLGRYSLAVGRQAVWAVFAAVAIVINIGLDLVLIPWTNSAFDNGAMGGALAYVFTEIVIITLAIRFVIPSLLNRSVVSGVSRSLLAGGVMLAVTWPLRDRFILIPILVGAALYCASTLILRNLNDEERHMIRRLANRGRALLHR